MTLTTCFKRKNIQIDKRIEKNIPVTGDPFLIKQAVSNLLQNAADFSPDGGRVIIITTSDKQQMILTIEDEGPGIVDFAREKVFDKFFSMRRPDTGRKSTGLGLNFVKEIAELHLGTIELKNTSPHGIRAILIMPV